jgi:hypothetical protein
MYASYISNNTGFNGEEEKFRIFVQAAAPGLLGTSRLYNGATPPPRSLIGGANPLNAKHDETQTICFAISKGQNQTLF